MKLREIVFILITSMLAMSALAQADYPQPPGTGSLAGTEPSNDAAVTSSSTLQPRDALNAYEEQMALVTVQAYAELAEIAQAVRSGQITTDEGQHLTRRCFELSIVRLQFLDTLHQIVETTFSKQGLPARPEEDRPEIQTSGEALVVAPPTSSPDIPESMVKYLELTPPQIVVIQTRMTAEQKEIQPLLQQLSQNRKALKIVAHKKPFNRSHIRKLAVEQSHILRQIILADSRVERDVYRVLTDQQRQKLHAAESKDPDLTEIMEE